MKRAIFFLLFLSIMSITSVYSQNSHGITVGIIDLNSEAVSMNGETINGHIGTLFQCTLANSGLEYTIVQLPLARLITYVESGAVDIGIPMAHTYDRDHFATFAVSQIDIPYAIVTMDTSLKLGDSLIGKEISTLNGSNLIGLIEAPGVKILRLKSYEQALSLVLAEHIYGAVVPTDMLVGLDEVNNSAANIAHWGTHSIGFYVSDKSPNRNEIVESLTRGYNFCNQ